MIQRIQSVFLFLGSLCFGGQVVWPFATSSDGQAAYFADGQYNYADHIGLLIVVLLGIATCIGAIFLFKNRQLQLRLSYLGIVLTVVLGALAALLYMNAGNSFSQSATVEDGIGLYLLPLGIIFLAFAARFIKKDDKLVRSMDRLR